jgi:hypothetical protein
MDKGSCDPILEADGILDHFQVMLKDAKSWRLFDDTWTMLQVLEVKDTSIVTNAVL